MTGELSERRAPFSPRNIPGQPVISMSEILLDPERYGDLLQVLPGSRFSAVVAYPTAERLLIHISWA